MQVKGLSFAGVFGFCLFFLPAEPTHAQHPTLRQEAAPRVFVFTLRHQSTAAAVALIRPLLSPSGTVEEQSLRKTVVVRDIGSAIDRVQAALLELDRPAQNLRFEIQVIQAGPVRAPISPPEPIQIGKPLGEELAGRLRRHLRYESFAVVAEAGLSSKEGENVSYTLGDGYDLSFKLGSIVNAKRLQVENFRVEKRSRQSADKGRQLKPRELFHANLNLWLDRYFTLVLADDPERQEALVIAIICRPEPQ
jgi:hypothetical protein